MIFILKRSHILTFPKEIRETEMAICEIISQRRNGSKVYIPPDQLGLHTNERVR